MMAAAPLLELRGITKVYGSTPALADVDLTVAPGEVHALLGENGAGKSTLIRILAGVEREDGGTLRFAGELLGRHRGTELAHSREIAFIHQDLGLVESLTVAENIGLYGGFPTGARGIKGGALRARARVALERLGLDIPPDAAIAELSIAERASVAIARALDVDARLIVLDEPTANLGEAEARRLLSILDRLRDSGVGCLLVSHRLGEIMRHADRATVLRNGRLVGVREIASTRRDQLVELIIGRRPAPAQRREPQRGGAPRVDVDGLHGAAFGPLSFSVAAGEILALTGLADAGHLGCLDALYGAATITSGTLRIDGAAYRAASPRAAMRRGIRYVPGDRSEGLAPALTVRENLFLNARWRGLRSLIRGTERERAATLLERFDVRPRDPEAAVQTLSGGNAQKVLLARTLADRPGVLLLSEPTAGVDIGARSDLYAKLREACADGLAIVLATSDFEEVAELADRALVLLRGTPVTTLGPGGFDVETVTEAAYGH